jgi:hypothetical protein
MCGWLDDRNSAGNDRWSSSVSDNGAVMGGRPAHTRRWAEAL